MQKTLEKILHRIGQQKRKQRIFAVATALLSFFVAVGVFWNLHMTGITLVNSAFCGVTEHSHTQECNDNACMLEEHVHTLLCYSDPQADLEESATWEATLPELTHIWAKDVVAVAKSQIGYTESQQNYILDTDGVTKRGYTRYGQWYGNSYGNWNASFAAFCLSYGGISEKVIPYNSGCYAWIADLTQHNLYRNADYVPVPGDLCFYGEVDSDSADRVGIVSAIELNTATPDSRDYILHMVEGDHNNSVAENSYTTEDIKIYGFCPLPAQSNITAPIVEPIGTETYTAWLDGSCGGIMSLYNATNKAVTTQPGGVLTLPTADEFDSPPKYDYKLVGWYDITAGVHYKPGDTVVITQNTVFYADWVAKSYNIGQNNDHVVNTVDLSNFVSIDLFDYNALFNVQSANVATQITSAGHDETWTMVPQGQNVNYKGVENSLGFIFLDWDWSSSGKAVSYPKGQDGNNSNGNIKQGILEALNGNNRLIDTLFNKQVSAIGKNYVGAANHLFQFVKDEASEFNGYYYYDSKKNAASYNQADGRFYVYDYLERTDDSRKDGGPAPYSDFLPLNSPYYVPEGQIMPTFEYNGTTNYTYDAKGTGEQNAPNHVTTNYWFGMKTEIKFHLPNDVGSTDSQGNYGNQSSKGSDMRFVFSGDDDVWVLVDDKLVLDIGGIHGMRDGSINFSTGEVEVEVSDGNTVRSKLEGITAGDHKITICYLERGSSQSNCAIYFNLAPRYNLIIDKENHATAGSLDGAEFSIFTDVQCTQPATLWANEKDYDNGELPTNVFTVVNGSMNCWGMTVGNKYYIKETKPPTSAGETYVTPKGIILVETDNNNRVSIIEEDGEHSFGFSALDWVLDHQLHLIRLSATNMEIPPDDTMEVSVEKVWQNDNAEQRPDGVVVHLLKNGERYGRTVTLNQENDWKFTWAPLPMRDDNGVIAYTVEEELTPGYFSVISDATSYENGESGLDGIGYTITNILLEEDNITELKVSKVWNDDEDLHSEIKVHLLANGHATGYTLVLNSKNDWKSVFEKLAINDADGNTITYTVQEEPVNGYEVEYSTVQKPGNSTWVTATQLVDGGIYRFINGNYALAYTSGTTVARAASSTNQLAQQWKAIASGTGFKLQNQADKSLYLRLYSQRSGNRTNYYVNVGTDDTYSTFTLNNSRLRSTQFTRYVQMGSSVTAATSGTQFTLSKLEESPPETEIIITNTPKPKGDLLLQKTDQSGAPLSGVEFEIYWADEQWNKGELVTKGQVNDQGELDFEQLSYGKYLLYETITPAGYHRPSTQWRVTIDAGGVAVTDEGGTALTIDNGRVVIVNHHGYRLPSTGGTGPGKYILFGLLLIAIPFIYWCLNKGKRGRKGMKKICTLILMVVIALSMTVTVLAAPETGSITVTNAKSGYTYSIYRILDLEGYNTTDNAYEYKVNAKWQAFIEGSDIDGVYLDATDNFKWVAGADVIEFINKVKAYADANSIAAEDSKTATEDGVITFADIPLGWYVMDSTMGALCVLDTTDPDMEVEDKNTEPTVSKTIKTGENVWASKSDAFVGDKVQFRIIISNNKGAEGYVLHDKIDSDFVVDRSSIVIKTDTTVANSNYTIKYRGDDPATITDECTFEIEFKQSFLDTLDENDIITVEYDAVLEAITSGDTQEENEAWLTYGDNNNTPPSWSTTYSWSFQILKFAQGEGGAEKVLAGAEFELYTDAQCQGTPINFVTASDGGDTVYMACKAEECTHTHTTKLISDANGLCRINGMDSGTYYLKETKQPEGYNILTEPVPVVIVGTEDEVNMGKLQLGDEYGNQVKVENTSGQELPSTGGIGTTLFICIGGLLVLVAVVFMVTRRKMASYVD